MSENTAVITDNSEVILHFDLKLEDGSAADSTRVNNKPAKMVMGDGSLTPNFEACLRGLTQGEKASFTLNADDPVACMSSAITRSHPRPRGATSCLRPFR